MTRFFCTCGDNYETKPQLNRHISAQRAKAEREGEISMHRKVPPAGPSNSVVTPGMVEPGAGLDHTPKNIPQEHQYGQPQPLQQGVPNGQYGMQPDGALNQYPPSKVVHGMGAANGKMDMTNGQHIGAMHPQSSMANQSGQQPMMMGGVDPQMMQQQQRLWTPNGPADQMGRPLYNQGMPNQMGGQDYGSQHVSSTHSSGLENVINAPSAYGSVPIGGPGSEYEQQNRAFMHAPQQQQQIVDAVNAALLTDAPAATQQMPYHQSSMPSMIQSSWTPNSWNSQPEVKSVGSNHLGNLPSAHLHYSGSTNSHNNRPTPYSLPPHHSKITAAGRMHHAQQSQRSQQMQQVPLPQHQQALPQHAYHSNAYMNSPMQPLQNQMNAGLMMQNSGMMGPSQSMGGYSNDMQHQQSMDMSNGMMNSDYGEKHVPGSMSGSVEMVGAGGAFVSNPSLGRLPDQAKNELAHFDARIKFSSNGEMSTDKMSHTSKEREQVPSLRLAVPPTYPQAPAYVERVPIDLELFYLDDLLNLIDEQLSKAKARTVTDIMSVWENTVSQFYANGTSTTTAS